MFGFLKRKTTEPTFELRQLDNKFGIVASDGTAIVGVYTRKRDAVRGAARKGITLANA